MPMDIHIIGGVYKEFCAWPAHKTIQGSGGRAALCLSQLDQDILIHLHSQIGDADEKDLQGVFKFCPNCTLKLLPSDETVKFSYFHPLSEPQITPPIDPKNLPLFKPISGRVDNAVIFGMIEATPAVNCKTAVYDPQNTYNPVLFSEKGCTAENLAYVTNCNELQIFYKKKFEETESVETMAKWLADTEKAKVVVVKCGKVGSFVYSEDEEGWVAPRKTKSVFSIGSGDAFVAAFSYFWLVKGMNPLLAAEKSSIAAAFYVENRTMNNPEGLDEFKCKAPPISQKQERIKIYLAGPFFTLSELWMVNEAKRYLEAFELDVFSPYHDVGIGSADEVVQKDIDAIDECDAMYAIFDGTDPGTLFEIGYARSLNKPVIILAENPKEEELKMYEGSGCQIFSDFTTSIYHTSWLEI